MHRVNSAGLSGTGRPRLLSQAAIRPGMSSGGRKTGSSASMTNRSFGSLAAARSSASTGPAALPQCRWHSCSSHSPLTLRR